MWNGRQDNLWPAGCWCTCCSTGSHRVCWDAALCFGAVCFALRSEGKQMLQWPAGGRARTAVRGATSTPHLTYAWGWRGTAGVGGEGLVCGRCRLAIWIRSQAPACPRLNAQMGIQYGNQVCGFHPDLQQAAGGQLRCVHVSNVPPCACVGCRCLGSQEGVMSPGCGEGLVSYVSRKTSGVT